MSSEDELERLLREARQTLPEPDDASTGRARAGALAASRGRRPRRIRVVAFLGTVAAALALAAGLALVAPTGTASRGPVELGFVPEPGWLTFQTGGENGEIFQTVAVASNVPLAAEDQVAGSADPSGLPYETLLDLPTNGIVIVATFARPSQPVLLGGREAEELDLPLGIRDATPYIQYGTQLRPEQPLGQYEIRGMLQEHSVDVHVYFGTPTPSSKLLGEADRQLAGIVVREGRDGQHARRGRPAVTASPSAPGVVDRTFACRPSLAGGAHKLDWLARRGTGRSGSSWQRPALAGVQTNISGSAATAIDNYLVWASAGRPTASASLWLSNSIELFDFPFRVWGTIAVNRKRCSGVDKRVALGPRGLDGSDASVFPDVFDCTTPKVVLVRVRAVTESRTALKSFRSFVRTVVPVKEASIAVQTRSGKPLAFAQLSETGASRIFVRQPPCFPG
jgi:hypothetical protein